MTKFKRVFITQPTKYDLSVLNNYADELIYVTSGLEPLERIEESVEVNMQEFNPAIDAIVPIGRATGVLIMSFVIARRLNGQKINVGVHKGKGSYEFIKV